MNIDEMKLADKVFLASDADWQIFDEVIRILGADPDNCGEPDFVWPATDTYYDYYDCSIEVIRDGSQPWMTNEQAMAILDLGFNLVYETVGSEAAVWSRSNRQQCSPRPHQASYMRLSHRYKLAMAKCGRLEREILFMKGENK